jgi:hypothetical protein
MKKEKGKKSKKINNNLPEKNFSVLVLKYFL